MCRRRRADGHRPSPIFIYIPALISFHFISFIPSSRRPPAVVYPPRTASSAPLLLLLLSPHLLRCSISLGLSLTLTVSVFDVHCYNALFRTLCQEKSMSDARNVYHSLKHEFKPNLHTFNILLSGWKSCDEAEAFFGEMKDMGVEPDLVSYNCLVDVFCKGRELQKAYNLIDRMRDEGRR